MSEQTNRGDQSQAPVERREVFFSGRVQGVGFRYTTREMAARYPAISGFVKNLPDGRVWLVVEGTSADLSQLIGAIDEEMERHITHKETKVVPARGEFDRFEVRH